MSVLTERHSVYFQLILSILMLIQLLREGNITWPTLRDAVPFSVPAVLYCINNNLDVHMQPQMDPATYQVG